MKDVCTACLMPYNMDQGERQNANFCSYCQKDGKFCFTGTRKEFQSMCYQSMLQKGIPKYKAKLFTFMIRFAPHWKKV